MIERLLLELEIDREAWRHHDTTRNRDAFYAAQDAVRLEYAAMEIAESVKLSLKAARAMLRPTNKLK